ncbi:Glycoside hydrolase family 9 [Dillenia turbinata]|uniref:cellulase n=1 Tax=Dillenia turbinata TaxID=194707 RepID=A0AAN8V314_9MAGN
MEKLSLNLSCFMRLKDLVNLVGGYYDAGDNVKFGSPMAYTITMLSWGAVEFGDKLEAKNELSNALDAIGCGADYFMNAHPEPNVLYGVVGDGDSDHQCWERPEDMTTPRPAFKIDEDHPGSDLAGETAAALAAASIAFKASDPAYSQNLLNHAKQDELLCAAAWLHRATGDSQYIDYLSKGDSGGTRNTFSWDDKSQMDYILGSNPKKMSYMGGFGSSYPIKIHHGGASIVSIKQDPTPVTCEEGCAKWFDKQAPNPNVLEGAIVGGPDENDEYNDSRDNYQQAEPATATNGPLVGVLAQLA